MTNLTIGILTHNRSWHFAQCLASVRQFTKVPYQIQVLDTNSTPEHRLHMHELDGPDMAWHFSDTFYSCLGGRRKLLDLCETRYMVYLDDDIQVAPGWIGNMMRAMSKDENCAAVTCNIVQEGVKAMSGTRYLTRVGKGFAVGQHDINHEGDAAMCMGGATLYRPEMLRKTEMRPEFNGGYEDWDQTLQLTQDHGHTIYGSRGFVFHRHMPECAGYFDDRWRWGELIDSAIGMWDRWKVRTAVDKVAAHYMKKGIALSKEQAARVAEVLQG